MPANTVGWIWVLLDAAYYEVLTGSLLALFSFTLTKTAAERALAIKMSIVILAVETVLVGLSSVLVSVHLIPGWADWAGLALFLLCLVPVYIWGDKRWAELRKQ